MSLSKPLSVRLSDEDTVFLAGLRIEGAVTASDKVRALIAAARERADAPPGLSKALARSREILAGPLQVLREAENEADVHSDVVLGLMVALEDMLAATIAAESELQSPNLADLARFEAKVVERAARLTEALLRWSVTPTAPAYDPKVVSVRMAALADLMQLVSKTV